MQHRSSLSPFVLLVFFAGILAACGDLELTTVDTGPGPSATPFLGAVEGDGGAGMTSQPPAMEAPGGSAGACGDGVCGAPEEVCGTCEEDCGACQPSCGDGSCAMGEACDSCEADCGACGAAANCGDGVCNSTETCDTCAPDCGACTAVCGDGNCAPEEACDSCAADCGACTSPASCGDGQCNGSEDCDRCAADCGACAVSCGDGQCNGGESCVTCSADCAACTPATCPPKYLGTDGACYARFFTGITLSDGDLASYMTNAVRYRELAQGPQSNLTLRKNPMGSIAQTGQWAIYYHFEEWNGAVTATAITNLTAQYQQAANAWMDTLDAFDPAAPKEVTIKVFGFVFNQGVAIDASFYSTYGNYPIVTDWDRTNEQAPWEVRSKADGSVSDQNWYNVPDFTTLEVTGNRTDVSAGVSFSPGDWSNYTHPEGIDMFFTKYWHRLPGDAVAQRQYLKMGGAIQDHAAGRANIGVLTHEMGHCFFHDDMYDTNKYPDGGGIQNQSVMHSAPAIGDFDVVVQRLIWETQR